MNFNKCSRCGNFYVTTGEVCPNCTSKDNLEFQTFQNYVIEKGVNENLNLMANETGITVKNLNRFINIAENNAGLL